MLLSGNVSKRFKLKETAPFDVQMFSFVTYFCNATLLGTNAFVMLEELLT